MIGAAKYGAAEFCRKTGCRPRIQVRGQGFWRHGQSPESPCGVPSPVHTFQEPLALTAAAFGPL